MECILERILGISNSKKVQFIFFICKKNFNIYLSSKKLKLNQEKETQIIEIKIFVNLNLLFEFFLKNEKIHAFILEPI